MFTGLLKNLKENRRTIVFTEGPDARILEAAARLLKEDLMDVILVGNVEGSRPRRRRTASTSPGRRSLTPPPTPAWTRWWPRWWSCARAR